VRRALFLDRDGTVIVHIPYLADAEDVALLPGAGEALARFTAADYLLVLITNQSGVGRGYFSETQLAAQHERLRELLAPYAVAFAALHYCPHRPDDGCTCRKPLPGMIQTAASELGINCGESWMVGDRESDIGAGVAAGCRTVLLADAAPAATAATQVQPALPAVADAILGPARP
jgi:D-glycero-D-manno-heptose 1,7-bisphosphate phosphatase